MTLNTNILIGLLLAVSFAAFAQQDSMKTVDIEEVVVTKKKGVFKKIGLYDDGDEEEEYNIRGYTQLLIFENDLTDEFWTSEGKKCISGALEGETEKFLQLNWNKDTEGCDWVGFGFGWDGWAGKDMAYVDDTLAIELLVRSTGKAFTNIPWAFCLEDYSGEQAWLGYNRSFLRAKEIGADWTKVEVPVQLFPYKEKEVDLSNIKQLLVQVFAAGTIEIKSIRLVPFSRKLKKELVASKPSSPISIDGNLDDWSAAFESIGASDEHSFAITYNKESLFFAFKIKDDSPRENSQQDEKLWNGDALEIAFSTNPSADANRNFLLLSDQHLGLNCGEKPYLWDWKTDKKLKDAKYKFKSTDYGYDVELEIPFKDFSSLQLKEGLSLDVEIAIDLNKGTVRKEQLRWNSSFEEGFHESPKKWGKLLLK